MMFPIGSKVKYKRHGYAGAILNIVAVHDVDYNMYTVECDGNTWTIDGNDLEFASTVIISDVVEELVSL